MVRLVLALFAASLAAACTGPRTKENAPPARGDVQYAEVEGARLAYELAGSGPTLVLVNGGAMDFRQWDDVVPAFAERFRVLRWDPRGWGRSSPPEAPFAHVDDLAVLLDRVGAEQVFLLGCSFGGGLALDFALAHQDRVRGLVLAGSSLDGFRWSPDFQRRNELLAESVKSGKLGAFFLDSSFIPAAQEDARLRERATRLILENSRLFSLDPSLAKNPPRPAIERLDEVRVPTLVLAPEKDHPDVLAAADVLATRIPGARKIVLAGAGHMAHMERPAEFARAVLEFLGKPEVAGGWPLVHAQDFERSGAEGDFVAPDPRAWRRAQVGGRACLEQFAQSLYEPVHRSPHNIALLTTPRLGSFVLEAELRQTGREYAHRDLCVFFAFRDPEHYLYAHLASQADENAHQVMRVEGAPRTPVTTARTGGVDWGTNAWRHLRVERDEGAGSVRVWLGDSSAPVLVAERTAPGEGWIGFGSFDDSGAFDDVRVWAPSAVDERAPFFASIAGGE